MEIVNIYEKYFSKDIRNIFSKLCDIAFEYNYKIYLIGGLVRDMLLNMPSLDIDITIEGNAIEFAQILEDKNIAEIKSIHKDFGTVKIVMNNTEIDLASTRSETYPQAGQLPLVTKIGCSLKEDILRRDFTVNSIAMSLNKRSFLKIIDYTNGLEDIKNKKIKILHDRSFIDDPTRIIRALKYAKRLNFSLEEQTKKRQKEYLDNINYNMGFKRILQEFKKTFSQKNPPYKEFIKQNIYKLLSKKEASVFETPKNNFSWIVYFGLIVDNIDKFELTKEEKEILNIAKDLENKNFSNDLEIYKTFCNIPKESLDILLIKKNKYAKKYAKDLSKIKIQTTGQDLINLGFKPSKKFSEIFDCILDNKIKNPKLTKEEELNIAGQFI